MMSKSSYQIVKNSYFLCYDATVYIFDPCGTPAGVRGKAYLTKWQVSNKSEHSSCVLIIIIGYRSETGQKYIQRPSLRSRHRAELQDAQEQISQKATQG